MFNAANSLSPSPREFATLVPAVLPPVSERAEQPWCRPRSDLVLHWFFLPPPRLFIPQAATYLEGRITYNKFPCTRGFKPHHQPFRATPAASHPTPLYLTDSILSLFIPAFIPAALTDLCRSQSNSALLTSFFRKVRPRLCFWPINCSGSLARWKPTVHPH